MFTNLLLRYGLTPAETHRVQAECLRQGVPLQRAAQFEPALADLCRQAASALERARDQAQLERLLGDALRSLPGLRKNLGLVSIAGGGLIRPFVTLDSASRAMTAFLRQSLQLLARRDEASLEEQNQLVVRGVLLVRQAAAAARTSGVNRFATFEGQIQPTPRDTLILLALLNNYLHRCVNEAYEGGITVESLAKALAPNQFPRVLRGYQAACAALEQSGAVQIAMNDERQAHSARQHAAVHPYAVVWLSPEMVQLATELLEQDPLSTRDLEAAFLELNAWPDETDWITPNLGADDRPDEDRDEDAEEAA